MSRKLVLGLLAWLPIVMVVGIAIYLVAFMAAQLGLATAIPHLDLDDPEVRHFLIVLVGGASVVALIQIVSSVVFIIDASSKAQLKGTAMALWAVGFIFFGELLFPIYWLLYVMRDAPRLRASEARVVLPGHG
jgi:hypothetical protein